MYTHVHTRIWYSEFGKLTHFRSASENHWLHLIDLFKVEISLTNKPGILFLYR